MSPTRPFAGPRGRLILKCTILVVTVLVAVGLDLLIKRIVEHHLVLGETHKILPFLYLQRVANNGVAFGLLGGHIATILVANFIAIAVVVILLDFISAKVRERLI